MTRKPRHVLGISGGKDSAALAIYMRDRIPDMEYFFCDTQKELPETYDFLTRLEAYLGKPIARLNSQKGFDHWLKVYGGYLPSTQMRWCTRQLKIRPFEEWIGEDETLSYVGIRADEPRTGYVSTKDNITPVFPFKDDGIVKDDVVRILEESGVGLPTYYSWRSRSGCYFCFFQRKMEWLGLKENHPDLFERAKAYEKPAPEGERGFTWCQTESLDELTQPERAEEIRGRSRKAKTARGKNRTLLQVLTDAEADDDEGAKPCMMCHL